MEERSMAAGENRKGRVFLRVLVKALALLVVFNLVFALAYPALVPGSWTLYNRLFPGRERFPFGENPAEAYNFSLYNLDAMFASLALNAAPKAENEFRVLVIGDSSAWGTLLHPEETLAGQLDALALQTCDGRTVRVYNLGYPTLSLVKDLMLLDRVKAYRPDLIVWPVTLEAFPRSRQLDSPIVANNAGQVQKLIAKYNLPLDSFDPALRTPNFWERTIIGQRRNLADLLRLQLYGVMWAATGIDQAYPATFTPAARDLEADSAFHDWEGPSIPADGLALELVSAGIGMAYPAPVLLVNEPILISTGKNSNIRYNFYYPRWVYGQYREQMARASQASEWNYVDFWNLVPQEEFTNTAIHLSPRGVGMLRDALVHPLLSLACGEK